MDEDNEEKIDDLMRKAAKEFASDLILNTHYAVSYRRGSHIEKTRLISEVKVLYNENINTEISFRFNEIYKTCYVLCSGEVDMDIMQGFFNRMKEAYNRAGFAPAFLNTGFKRR